MGDIANEPLFKQCKDYYPLSQCSGHGVCNNQTGLCECDAGWTSIGDFSTQQGDHCSIHILSVRLLWIITLVASPPLFYYSLKLLKMKVISATPTEKSNKNRSNKCLKHSIFNPSIIFALSYLIASVLAFVLAILKLSDPITHIIGKEILSTLLFSLSVICCVTAICMYLVILVKFILGYLKMMPSESRDTIRAQSTFIKRLGIATACISPFFSLIAFINVIYPHHDVACVKAFFGFFIFIAIYLVPGIIRYLYIIEQEINKHLIREFGDDSDQQRKRAENLKKIKDKLHKTRITLIFAVLPALVPQIIIITWDLIAKNTSYLWPLSLGSTNQLYIVFILSVMNGSNESTSASETQDTKSKRNDAVITPTQMNHQSPTGSKITVGSTEEQVSPKIMGDTYDEASSTNRIAPSGSQREEA